MNPANECYDLIESPLGTIVIVCQDDAMLSLHFLDRNPQAPEGRDRVDDPHGYSTRIKEYFNGDINALDEIKVKPEGTPFQQEVWKWLRSIPAGQTDTYGNIAEKIGRPNASRAVGLANGQNPISLVIPCHRVIGTNGKLTGYGGGLNRKQWLLEHEGALTRNFSSLP